MENNQEIDQTLEEKNDSSVDSAGSEKSKFFEKSFAQIIDFVLLLLLGFLCSSEEAKGWFDDALPPYSQFSKFSYLIIINIVVILVWKGLMFRGHRISNREQSIRLKNFQSESHKAQRELQSQVRTSIRALDEANQALIEIEKENAFFISQVGQIQRKLDEQKLLNLFARMAQRVDVDVALLMMSHHKIVDYLEDQKRDKGVLLKLVLEEMCEIARIITKRSDCRYGANIMLLESVPTENEKRHFHFLNPGFEGEVENVLSLKSPLSLFNPRQESHAYPTELNLPVLRLKDGEKVEDMLLPGAPQALKKKFQYWKDTEVFHSHANSTYYNVSEIKDYFSGLNTGDYKIRSFASFAICHPAEEYSTQTGRAFGVINIDSSARRIFFPNSAVYTSETKKADWNMFLMTFSEFYWPTLTSGLKRFLSV